MTAESHEVNLDSLSRDIVQSLEGAVSWEWDNRFGAALTAFSVGQQEVIQQALKKSLCIALDASNIEQATEPVQAISRNLGGITPGQQLLISNPETGSFLFCAWWPWGNGESVSIRVAPVFTGDDADKQELLSQFKKTFGVE